MWGDFLTALQFLTRIRLAKQESWDDNSFARSVTYFPFVGCVIGLVLLAVLILLMNAHVPASVTAALLIVLEILLTGGLTCDGYMDTADGVFSGRSRERMLEIMKDSCVGSNGVIAFSCMLLIKYTVYVELSPMYLGMALLVMPTITRGLMVFNIRNYKYARESGIGGMFVNNGHKQAGVVLSVCCIILLMFFAELIDIQPDNIDIALPLIVVLIYNYLAANYLSRVLGGLTGDTYGFLAESAGLVYLITLCVYLSGKTQMPWLPL